MNKPIVILDTGVITQYLSSSPPLSIIQLFDQIKNQKYHAETIPLVISEAYKHICVKKGQDQAKLSLISFQNDVSIELIHLDMLLSCKVGKLKCQFREKLSYVDCAIIILALEHNATLHTTEKELPKLEKLKIKSHFF